MLLLDRYILTRFAVNFALLFTLLFLFAVGIDVLLNLDEFIEAADDRGGQEGFMRLLTVVAMVANFQVPRLFLFFSYLHALIAIGATGFTLAHMVRHRELIAMLASGVSLSRVAVPLVVGMFAVSLLQLLNQEFILHRVAPLVLRGHTEIGRGSMSGFPVRFMDDGRGNLWHSPGFDPATDTMRHPTIVERDERGRTVRRVWADAATWDAERGGWRLDDGAVLSLPGPGQASSGRQRIEFYPTDLDPRALTLRRYGEYAAMLSLRQIGDMLSSERVADAATLLRHRYARFAMVAVNLLVLFVCLPSLLLREPVSLMRQSLLVAGMAIPALFGAALAMTLALPGVPPAVGVFLPVALLIPMAAGRWTMVKT